MKKWIIIILSFIFLSIAFFYKTPYKINHNFYASTVSGSTVQININMEGYRNFLSPTEYHGEILVDNIKYKTVDFTKKWKLTDKISGSKNYPRLISEDAKSVLDRQKFLTFFRYSEKFNKIEFYLNGEIYYSPAKDAIEARQLQNDSF